MRCPVLTGPLNHLRAEMNQAIMDRTMVPPSMTTCGTETRSVGLKGVNQQRLWAWKQAARSAHATSAAQGEP